jgi:hypothetical protein
MKVLVFDTSDEDSLPQQKPILAVKLGSCQPVDFTCAYLSRNLESVAMNHVISTCHSGAMIGYSTYQFSVVSFIGLGDFHVKAVAIAVNRDTVHRFCDYIQSGV